MLIVVLIGVIGFNYAKKYQEREKYRVEVEKKRSAVKEKNERDRIRLKENADAKVRWEEKKQQMRKLPKFIAYRKVINGFHEELRLAEEASSDDLKIKRLVLLDKKLRRYVYYNENRTYVNENGNLMHGVDMIIWDAKDSELGLWLQRNSDRYEYSGQFLHKAHKLNPNSEYREYTLFSTINSKEYCWVEKIDNLRHLNAYLKEFPEGVYISEIYRLLGDLLFSMHNITYYDIKDNKKISDRPSRAIFEYMKGENVLSENEEVVFYRNESIKYFDKYFTLEENPSRWVLNKYKQLSKDEYQRFGFFSCPD